MISLPKRDAQELQACLSIKDTPDFKTFRGWLERSLEEAKTSLMRTGNDTELRWAQGKAQALQEILARIDETASAMERLRR